MMKKLFVWAAALFYGVGAVVFFAEAWNQANRELALAALSMGAMPAFLAVVLTQKALRM